MLVMCDLAKEMQAALITQFSNNRYLTPSYNSKLLALLFSFYLGGEIASEKIFTPSAW